MLEFATTTPVQIFNGIKEMEASRQPYALTAVMLAASLGITIDKVDVVQGNTDLAQGFGSVGSRSMFVGGTAVAVSPTPEVSKQRGGDHAADRVHRRRDHCLGSFGVQSGDQDGAESGILHSNFECQSAAHRLG